MAGDPQSSDLPANGGRDELLQELQVRDEELKESTEELTEQLAELQRASSLLERERSKYIDLFMNAPEAYINTDVDGLIHEANVACARLFSSEPNYLVGRPLISFVARQDTRMFRTHLKSLVESGALDGPPSACQLRMRPRGHAPFFVTLKATIVRDALDKPIAIRWNLCRVDPTEAGRDRMLAGEYLVGTMARDLRGPLATIGGLAQALLEGQMQGEHETRQALAWIQRAAIEQHAMLDELASAVDAPDEASRSSPEALDLNEHVTTAVSSVADSLGPGRIAVRALASPGAAFVRSPSRRLGRVLELFLRRALEGTPRNGAPVVVRVSAASGEALVDIETPPGARVPLGWELRMTLAAYVVRGANGSLVLSEEAPSVRLRLPLVR